MVLPFFSLPSMTDSRFDLENLSSFLSSSLHLVVVCLFKKKKKSTFFAKFGENSEERVVIGIKGGNYRVEKRTEK